MMGKIEQNRIGVKNTRPGVIHVVLIYVYSIFFASIVLGISFDLIFKLDLLANFKHSYFGLIIIVFGTMLIYLAQEASCRAGKIKQEESSVEGFAFGPYKHFRHPTYLGIFLMVLGFGIIIKSVFSILFILITYLIVKLVFVRKEEKILEKKYGQIYLDYKKKVKM
jgi:protein-S-isoprenylcysteine O-methyltransferase Ste14